MRYEVVRTVELIFLSPVVMVVLPKDRDLDISPEAVITLITAGTLQCFTLKSVIDHFGVDRSGCHYTASVLSPSGWLICDKSNATYFYERSDIFSEDETRGIASNSSNATSKPFTSCQKARAPSSV